MKNRTLSVIAAIVVAMLSLSTDAWAGEDNKPNKQLHEG
jgi:hypothetical protein